MGHFHDRMELMPNGTELMSFYDEATRHYSDWKWNVTRLWLNTTINTNVYQIANYPTFSKTAKWHQYHRHQYCAYQNALPEIRKYVLVLSLFSLTDLWFENKKKQKPCESILENRSLGIVMSFSSFRFGKTKAESLSLVLNM